VKEVNQKRPAVAPRPAPAIRAGRRLLADGGGGRVRSEGGPRRDRQIRAHGSGNQVIGQHGKIIAFYPASIGSTEKPAPTNHVAFIQQSAAGRLCLNGYVSNPVPCSESRFVRVELNAVEIHAFVEWGYLEPKDREDRSAIEAAANAAISDLLGGFL